MNLHQARQMTEDAIRVHLDPDKWEFAWSRAKRTFGICVYPHYTKKGYQKGKIKLSKIVTEVEPIESVLNTIQHEVAHAIAGFKAGHGPQWVAAAKSIGMKNPKRLADTSDEYHETVKPLWVMVYKTEIVKKYYRRPGHRTFYGLNRMSIRGRKSETLGKLQIISFSEYQQIAS